MPKLIISEEVRAAIEAAAILPFHDTAVKIGDDLFEIYASDETMELIAEYRQPKESVENALRRLLRLSPQPIN